MHFSFKSSNLQPPGRATNRVPRRSRPALLLLAVGLTLLPALASAQTPRPLPISERGVVIKAGQDLVYRIDLSTIPERPEIHIEVTPTASNPTMEIEIEATNWQGLANGGQCAGGGVYNGGPSFTLSPPGVGSAFYPLRLRFCEPRIAGGFWEKGTVDIRVRVLDFGTRTSPAKLDVSIRGITQVATAEHTFVVQPDPGPQTVFLDPSKDAVLYQSTPSFSNGGGQYLWAGQDYDLIQFGVFQFPVWRRLNSLLAFNVSASIPKSAVVNNADLTLFASGTVNGGGLVSLFEAAPSPTGDDWSAGFDNAPGFEFTGIAPSGFSANWNYRRGTAEAWVTPGGDTVGSPLTSRFVLNAGDQVFSSNELTNAVQRMVEDEEDDDGFVLKGPFSSSWSYDRAVRFASDQFPTASRRPELRVDYDLPGPYSEGQFTSGTVVFIGEGENLRWIYDTDGDDIFVTDIQGVCEVTNTATTPDFPALLPYSYTYQGQPGYTGVDCCTWQVDSPQTGTVGTGQAIFFHGIDPATNLPPDADGDGMRDPCDNCVGVPNGPLLGSCIGIQGVGGTCRSDLECSPNEFCSLSQEDADFDLAGDACSVPEPGFAAGLFAGLAGLALRSRREPRPGISASRAHHLG